MSYFNWIRRCFTDPAPSLPPDPDTSSSIARHLPGFLYRCENDHHWTMLYVSEGVEAITGYQPGDLVHNRSTSYEELIHPDDRERVRSEVDEALAEQEYFSIEYRVRHRSGEEFWVEEQGEGIHRKGTVQYLQGYIQDVTQDTISRMEDRILREAASSLSQFKDLGSALGSVLQSISHHSRWSYAEAWVPGDRDRLPLRMQVHPNPDNAILTQYRENHSTVPVTPGTGPIGRVWQSGQSNWIESDTAGQTFLTSEPARQNGLDAAFATPCRTNGEPMAVLVFYRDHHRTAKWIETLLQNLSEPLGRLLRQTKLEADLAARETQFRELAETLEMDLWIANEDYSGYQYQNPAFRDTWGDYFQDCDDVAGAFLEAVHPEDRQRIRRKLKDQVNEGYDETFRIHRPTDGCLRWYRDRAFPVRDESGNLRRIVGFGRDITEQKQIRDELERYQRRFRQIADNIQEVIWLVDRDFSELMYVNPHYEELFEQKLETIRRQPRAFLKQIHPEDHDRVKMELDRFLDDDDRDRQEFQYRLDLDDDRKKWVWTQAVSIRNDREERVRIAGFSKNITRQKQLQNELETSLQQQNTLLKEVHHRVKNNLQIIVSLLKLQAREMKPDSSTHSLFKDIENRVYSMALIHERIYEESSFENIDIEHYLTDLVEHVVTGHTSPSLDLDLDLQLDPVHLDVDTLLPCGIIVTELVTNALEHAFVDRSSGRIQVRFRVHDEGTYEFSVSDNGVGMPEDRSYEETRSLGLTLVRNLARRQLAGTLDVDTSAPGVRVRVRFTRRDRGSPSEGSDRKERDPR